MGADLERWIEQLRKCEPIKESEVKILCQQALDVLVEESNVQRVSAPVTICACPHLVVLLIGLAVYLCSTGPPQVHA